MKKIVILSVFAVFLLGCQNKESFKVSGTIENYNEKMVYLDELNPKGYTTIDSIKTDKNGSFELTVNKTIPNYYKIHNKKNINYSLIASGGDNIRIKSDADNQYGQYEISGSDASEDLNEMQEIVLESRKKLDSLSTIARESRNKPNYETIRTQLTEAYQKLKTNLRQELEVFIDEKSPSMSLLFTVYQQLGSGDFVFRFDQDIDIFEHVDSVLNENYEESPAAIMIKEDVKNIKSEMQAQKTSKNKLQDGSKAPEISLPTPEGEIKNLSSLQGKYVLLDFWASWCPPCRKENPFLVEEYNKYHDKGFEIYQVSLDKNKQAWVEAIKKTI